MTQIYSEEETNHATTIPATATVSFVFFFSSRRRHTRFDCDWSSDVCSSDLAPLTDFREKMLFIRGLYNEEAQKGNIHSSQTGNLLSGAPLASGGEIRSGTRDRKSVV